MYPQNHPQRELGLVPQMPAQVNPLQVRVQWEQGRTHHPWEEQRELERHRVRQMESPQLGEQIRSPL